MKNYLSRTCIILTYVLLIQFSLSCKKDNNETTDPILKSTVTDIDGNEYNTITIGTQTWMVENLKVTKYNNGTPIPNITDSNEWTILYTGAYVWYNNDNTTYGSIYGALYNWYAVNTGILCPCGWHVPSLSEWLTLSTYFGGNNISGGKLKETGTAHWHSPNTGATNESGFTALPGGRRDYWNEGLGAFSYLGVEGFWWSTDELDATEAVYSSMSSDFENLFFPGGSGDRSKNYGISVRCVKD